MKKNNGEGLRLFSKQVRLPIESFGPCKIRSCKIVGVLAEGLCVSCWDRKGEG